MEHEDGILGVIRIKSFVPVESGFLLHVQIQLEGLEEKTFPC